MNKLNIGNPQNVYVDINNYAVREGMWYTHLKQGAIKVISLSDAKMDYQTYEMLNSGVFKVLAGPISVQLFLSECKCTGFTPNGKHVDPRNFDSITSYDKIDNFTTEELIKELVNRKAIREVDEKLQLYQIK